MAKDSTPSSTKQFESKMYSNPDFIYVIFKAWALWPDAFYKSICPYVCVSVCLFTFEIQFKRLFAPPSESWMSKIFRDSESLGKSNANKWSQICKLTLIKGVEWPRKKKFFLCANVALLSRIIWYQCFSLHLPICLPPLSKFQCPSF